MAEIVHYVDTAVANMEGFQKEIGKAAGPK